MALVNELKKLARAANVQQSIIFDRSEASKYDTTKFVEIGQKGLTELIEIDKNFEQFNHFFDDDIDRSLATKDENIALDIKIKQFFFHLSPYLLQKATLQVLEFLSFKYQIYKFNIDDLIGLIMPYHGTKVFAIVLQMIDLSQYNCKQWIWLKPCQKTANPLSKMTLIKHAASSVPFLNFFSEIVITAVKNYGQLDLSHLFKFYINFVFGAFNTLETISEQQMSSVLSVILVALSGDNVDLLAGAYMIIAQISQKTIMKKKLLKSLLTKICAVKVPQMQMNSMRLMLIVYDYQKQYTLMPDDAVGKMLKSAWTLECLANLQNDGYILTPLLAPLINAIFRNIFAGGNSQYSEGCKYFVSEFLNVIHLNESDAKTFFTLLLDHFVENNEILTKWVGELIKKFERKYAVIFDEFITNLLTENDNDKLKSIWATMLNVEDSDSNSTLNKHAIFINLLHPNVKIRLDALENVIVNINSLKNNDSSFLKSSLLNIFNDDDVTVITTFLKSFKSFYDMFSKRKILDFMIVLLEKFKDSRKVVSLVSAILVSEEFFESEFRFEILFVLMPFLFPLNNKKDLRLAKQIQTSYMFTNWSELDSMSEIVSSDCIVFQQNIVERFAFNDFLSKFLQDSLINGESMPIQTKTHIFLIMYLLTKQYEFQKNDKFLAEILDEILVKSKYCSKSKITEMTANGDDDFKFVKESLEHCQNNVIPISSFLTMVNKLLTAIELRPIESIWPDFSVKSTYVKVQIASKLLNWLHCKIKKKSNLQSQISEILNKFFDSKFEAKSEIVFLINLIMFHENQSKIQCYNTLCLLLKDQVVTDKVMLSLIMGLLSPNNDERELCMKCLDVLKPKKDSHLMILWSTIRELRSQVLFDHDAIPSIVSQLAYEISPKMISGKFLITYDFLVNLVQDKSTPIYIIAQLVTLLRSLKSTDVFQTFLHVINDRILRLKGEFQNDYHFNDISSIVTSFLSHLNETSIKNLNVMSEDWIIFIKLLIEPRCIQVNGSMTSISNQILKTMNAALFECMKFDNQKDFFNQILNILADNNSSTVKKFVKKITIDLRFVTDYFIEKNINITTDFLNGPYWKRIIVILELLQDQQYLRNAAELLDQLFMLLQKCLLFEDQSFVEYGKQLLLTAITTCSQCIDVSMLQNIFNMDLIIQCFHSSDNIQSHHHALVVLSEVANYLPVQVLHNIVSIFTFIGSSTARKEDEYSFNLVTNILEVILPILINSNGQVAKVVDILRVFADVILDVPEHRRLRLYEILLSTLGCRDYLWLFILLTVEAHVRNDNLKKKCAKRIDFAFEFIDQLDALCNFQLVSKLLVYLNAILVDYKENAPIKYSSKFETFNPEVYTLKQFQNFQSILVEMIVRISSSYNLLEKVAILDSDQEETVFQPIYKELLVQVLLYIQTLNCMPLKNSKWSVIILQNVYKFMENLNQFLTNQMFLLVVDGLFDHSMITIRQKSLDFLNAKLENGAFDQQDSLSLLMVLDKVVTIVNQLSFDKDNREMERYEQTALVTLKLLTKLLAKDNLDKFETILNKLIKVLQDGRVKGDLLSSMILTIVEISVHIRLRALNYTSIFIPILLNIFDQLDKQDHLLLLSCLTSLHKILEFQSVFISLFLKDILITICKLSDSSMAQDLKFDNIGSKLQLVKHTISKLVPLRVLLEKSPDAYDVLFHDPNNRCQRIMNLMNILLNAFKETSISDINSLQKPFVTLCIKSLNFRFDVSTDAEELFDVKSVNIVEEKIIETYAAGVLKMADLSFYGKLYVWASKDDYKIVTFYALSSVVANQLKSIFVPSTVRFLRHAADVLDRANKSKHKQLLVNLDVTLCNQLICNILKLFYEIFLNDGQNFMNKERFDIVMAAIVDQLENELGDREMFLERNSKYVIPCIAQLTEASVNNIFWKQLNEHILLKTRHKNPLVRQSCLRCLCEIVRKITTDFLPLLPESIRYLSELLEDDDENVERVCKSTIQELSAVLGEPIEKYF